jgi:hypothetical protein
MELLEESKKEVREFRKVDDVKKDYIKLLKALEPSNICVNYHYRYSADQRNAYFTPEDLLQNFNKKYSYYTRKYNEFLLRFFSDKYHYFIIKQDPQNKYLRGIKPAIVTDSFIILKVNKITIPTFFIDKFIDSRNMCEYTSIDFSLECIQKAKNTIDVKLEQLILDFFNRTKVFLKSKKPIEFKKWEDLPQDKKDKIYNTAEYLCWREKKGGRPVAGDVVYLIAAALIKNYKLNIDDALEIADGFGDDLHGYYDINIIKQNILTNMFVEEDGKQYLINYK